MIRVGRSHEYRVRRRNVFVGTVAKEMKIEFPVPITHHGLVVVSPPEIVSSCNTVAIGP